MKNKIFTLSIILILTLILVALLNITVTTKQGINYHVKEVKLPLYLKLLNFYDRHFNYKWLVQHITNDLETKEEKVFRLFQWTHETIQPQPKSLPVMDDHVWNVYVRGYGVSDNFHDLFTTLCNYIGADAFFHELKSNESELDIAMSFVKIKKGWVLFDPHKGIYFSNKMGEWATIEEINNQNWKLEKLSPTEIPESFFKPYLDKLPSVDNIGLTRANTQSPVNRLLLAIQRTDF